MLWEIFVDLLMHDPFIVSRHDGQKQEVISEGDVLSLVDDSHFKSHEQKVSANVDADLLV